MKTKRVLAANPKIDQFVEQDFPVVCDDRDIFKRVKVIEYLQSTDGTHKSYECSTFHVEVLKDYGGHISFLVFGDCYNPNHSVWIMRTDDFNRAYNLKNRLQELSGVGTVTDDDKMPCYGSLQREKYWWEMKEEA